MRTGVPRPPVRVLLPCPGLEHANRGFETFARECFDALRQQPDLTIELIKGSGPRADAERSLPTLTRDTKAARVVGRALHRKPFVVEHVAFAVPLAPVLRAWRPDVVFFSEWHLGKALAAWRRLSRQRFALVLSNGSLAPGPYGHLDHVQQLAPGAIEYTVARGERPEIQTHLPLGLAIEAELSRVDRTGLRRRLGLPEHRRIVLSAGALNRQKRIQYLVEEVASLAEPRPFLLLLGQQEPDTPPLRDFAQRRLGEDGYAMRTVPKALMPDYYRASDAFVLASLWESFGRVLVEAQSHGLPCLAHDYPVMRWVLGTEGDVRDLSQPGAVAAWLADRGSTSLGEEARLRRHRAAYERFSWEVLTPRYVEMLRAAAARS